MIKKDVEGNLCAAAKITSGRELGGGNYPFLVQGGEEGEMITKSEPST